MSFDFKNSMSQRNQGNKSLEGRRPPVYAAHDHSTNTQIDGVNGTGDMGIKNNPSPRVSRRKKVVK